MEQEEKPIGLTLILDEFGDVNIIPSHDTMDALTALSLLRIAEQKMLMLHFSVIAQQKQARQPNLLLPRR